MEDSYRSRHEKTDLIEKAGITSNILAKIGKGEFIAMDSLKKICVTLDVDVGDVVSLNNSEVGVS